MGSRWPRPSRASFPTPRHPTPARGLRGTRGERRRKLIGASPGPSFGTRIASHRGGCPLREVHMDMPSPARASDLIDRAAMSAGADHSGAALEQANYLHHAGSPWFLALTALGVVFGDIGTSPLYAFQVALSGIGHVPTAADVLGIVSLILWALVVMVSLKYVTFILRADNDGEGGIL